MNAKPGNPSPWPLAFLPLVLIAVCYTRLPGQIFPAWGAAAGSRNVLWLLAVLGPVLALLQGRFRSAALVLLWLLNGATVILLSALLQADALSWGRTLLSLLGLMYLFIGMQAGKLKTNFLSGFRNIWTLSDPDVWNKTHRLSGKLTFLSGLLILLSSVLLSELVTLLLLGFCSFLILLIPTIMSWVWSRHLPLDGDPRS